MDIAKQLTNSHSKALTMAITKYIGANQNRFKELMDVFLKGDYVLSQRAAWPLSYVLTENPVFLKKYFPALIKKLKEKNNHPAVHRNILRVFEEVEIPEKYRGELVDICFGLIPNESVPGAIRAFAITTAVNICKHYPELKNELLLLFKELQQQPQSPAVRVRIKSGFKLLQKA